MIAIDVSKQHVLEADPKAIQQINFTANSVRVLYYWRDTRSNVLCYWRSTGNCSRIFTGNCQSFVNAKYKMTQYNSLNVKLSNSQLNKLKPEIENETKLVLRLSSNMIGDDETNFSHKLLLFNRQVSNLRKAFANYLSTDIKLSKTQWSKTIQSGGFLG